MTTHIQRNFYNDNTWSLAARDESFWIAVYKKAFPNLEYAELCDDKDKQKMGIDRILYLSNGNVLYVDEKKRSKDFPDILLEHTSNAEYKTPGWIEKDLSIDYLAYAFLNSRRCYLFPFPMLRRAWLEYGEKWKREHRKIISTTEVGNTCYHTISVAIPTIELQKAVALASVIQL